MHALIGKNEYIEQLLEKYGDMVYRLALSRTKHIQTAEDIFQEVFLKLTNKLPEFKNESHEKAWLIRVTINCSKNLLSSAWYKRNIPLEENCNFITEEKKEIYFEVLNLPQKERTIIHLFYYEQFKLSEIARLLNITEKNAKTKLFRARKKLADKLKGGFDDGQ